MTHDAFISFSSKDREAAEKICHGLETRGISCWMSSRNVLPGADFAGSIVAAVEASRVMVLVFSANANNSDEMKKELVLASGHKLPVLPVRIENFLPTWAQLTGHQFIDLFDDWDSNLEKLAEQITRLINPGQKPSEQPALPKPETPLPDPGMSAGPALAGGKRSELPRKQGRWQWAVMGLMLVGLALRLFAGHLREAADSQVQAEQEEAKQTEAAEERRFETEAAEAKLAAAGQAASPTSSEATNPTMVVIPAGIFIMGASNVQQQHPHSVSIRSFAMGKYDVTRGEYSAFVRETGYSSAENGCAVEGTLQAWAIWQYPGFSQTDRDPVVCIKWQDAQAYISWLNGKTGAFYRLPSEAEWEYAARAGTTSEFWWGDDEAGASDHAWYEDNSGYHTHPVGGKPANSFGLYDMVGNVWQWTADCYVIGSSGAPSDGSAAVGNNSCDRVFRGGSWLSHPWGLRSPHRASDTANFRSNDLGFRLARTLP